MPDVVRGCTAGALVNFPFREKSDVADGRGEFLLGGTDLGGRRARAGLDGLDRLLGSIEDLPTDREFVDPLLWCARVGVEVAVDEDNPPPPAVEIRKRVGADLDTVPP